MVGGRLERRVPGEAPTSALGAESPSGTVVIDSIFPSDLSPNAVVGVRTGLANFTVRERSGILDDAGDKISRSGKRVLANQKYRQAQHGDLTVFSIGFTRAHSKTVRITVKWFGCGATQLQAKIDSLNNSGIYKSCAGLTIGLGSSTEGTLNHCFFYDILR